LDIEADGKLGHMIAEKRTDENKSVAICAHGMHCA
jgi:hypothetical protein